MCLCFENWINGLGKWATKISYIMLTIEKTAKQDSYLTLLLVFVICKFSLISCYCFIRYGRKAYIHDESGASGRRIGSPNNYGMNLRYIRTGLDFSEDFWINREAVSNSRTNVKTFVFLTQKEPVHKSHLLMKPTTLGTLHARATIVQFSERLVFCHYFPLRCHRRGWKAAHEALLTFIFYAVIIMRWQVVWHSFFLGWQLPPRATPVDPPLQSNSLVLTIWVVLGQNKLQSRFYVDSQKSAANDLRGLLGLYPLSISTLLLLFGLVGTYTD